MILRAGSRARPDRSRGLPDARRSTPGSGLPDARRSVRLLSVIDLRSDTVTKPTPAMRQAMLAAPVGDDVYAEDPTVIELEQRVARLLGHEAGLFCVSGSMCNMLGVRLLVEPGQEVVCDVQAHIARAEMGAHGAVGGLTMRTFPVQPRSAAAGRGSQDHCAVGWPVPGVHCSGGSRKHP